MVRFMLTDELWHKLYPVLCNSGIYDTKNLRLTIEGILWRLRVGAPWRDLPPEFGSWKSIFNQYNRWSKRDTWKIVFEAIRGEIDSEWTFIDGTIVKVHQHGCGSHSKNKEVECIGKSRGGNTTKIHMAADSHGNPSHFEISIGS